MRAVGSFFVHLSLRARWVISSPSALLTLVVFGVAGVFFWPAAWAPSHELLETPAPFNEGWQLGMLWVMWLYMWPMLPAMVCRGRASGGGSRNSLSTLASPAIPVGRIPRAVAEAVLMIVVAATVRAVVALGVGDLTLPFVFKATVWGAALMLPVATSYTLNARGLNVYMLRPLVISVLVTAAAAVRLTDHWLGLIAVVVAGCWLAVRLVDLEEPDLGWRSRFLLKEYRSRPAGDPLVRLRLDTWTAPLETWGPWIAGSATIFVAAMLLDAHGMLFEWGFFAAFEVYLIIVLQVVFRPLGSNLAMEGLVGKHGAKRGDFLRAWSVMPVSPHRVLRRVWLHGIVFGLMTWLLPVALLGVRSLVRFGELGLLDSDGDSLSVIILPSAAFVPMFAGFLVAACAGRKLETAVSGITLVLGVHTTLIFRSVMQGILGRGSLLVDVVSLSYVGLLLVAASVPPLLLLRAGAMRDAVS